MKILKIIAMIIVILVISIYSGYKFKASSYQSDASKKRVYDTHVIAHLAVDYKNITGEYPLQYLTKNPDIEVVALITYYSFQEIFNARYTRPYGYTYNTFTNDQYEMIKSTPENHIFVSFNLMLS